MKNKLKVYKVQYASGLLQSRTSEQYVYSEKELKEDDFIVVEHIDYGLFIGKVLYECTVDFIDGEPTGDNVDKFIMNNIDYRYIQHIDLDDYFKKLKNEKRKQQLKNEMEERFKIIDKEQKYKLYATLDEQFNKLYEEYTNL